MTSQPMTAVERAFQTIVSDYCHGEMTDDELKALLTSLAALTPASEEVEKVAVKAEQCGNLDVIELHRLCAEMAALLRRLDAERGKKIEALNIGIDAIRKLRERRHHDKERIETLTAELATLRAQAGEKE